MVPADSDWADNDGAEAMSSELSVEPSSTTMISTGGEVCCRAASERIELKY